MERKVFAIALLLCIAGIIISGCTIKPPDSEYPDFTLTSSRGEQVSLASFRGKSIVVLGVGNPYT